MIESTWFCERTCVQVLCMSFMAYLIDYYFNNMFDQNLSSHKPTRVQFYIHIYTQILQYGLRICIWYVFVSDIWGYFINI